jgi:hypothetical protein
MRSREASAATARAFSLVIQPGFDRARAGRVLADTSTTAALEEAAAHLGPFLFDDDRVAARAADILVLAWERRAAARAA